MKRVRARTADLVDALDRQDQRIAAGPWSPIDGAEGAYLNPDLARHLAGPFGNFVYPTSRGEFGVSWWWTQMGSYSTFLAREGGR